MSHDQYCLLAAHANLLISEGVAMECLLINHLDGHNQDDFAEHIACLAGEFHQQLERFRYSATSPMYSPLELIIARSKSIELILKAWLNSKQHDTEQAEVALTLIQENTRALNAILVMLSDL